MKNKVKAALMMFVLVIGLSISVGAQTIRRRPNGRTVVVLTPNRNRVNRNWHSGPNNRYWMRGARTVRLPNGRLVTILPNGRRIYH
jgi:hypothetical protein